jgi:hypothetical protein
MGEYYLYTVIVKKPISLEDAREWAQHYIQCRKRKFYYDEPDCYRFKNMPRNFFAKKSLKTKKINDFVELVYGQSAADDM